MMPLSAIFTMLLAACALILAGCAAPASEAHGEKPIAASPAPPPPADVSGLARIAAKLRDGKPITVVLWGDSISEVGRSARWHGGASAPDKNFGAVLVNMLRARFPKSQFKLIHGGIGGQNTYEGLGRLDALFAHAPDLVIVEFGTNDTAHHYLLPEETGQAMEEMLRKIKAVADVVCVGTGGNAPGQKFLHVQETIEATRAAAAKQSVIFVDIRRVMMEATGQGANWGEFHVNAGNCHPNDRGHVVWAKAIFESFIQGLPGVD